MDFLPTLPVLLAYIGAVFFLAITPGPDMVFFLGKAITQNRAAGIAAVLGASTGILGHTLLVAIGLSALLKASVTAFTILKVVGALYLLWLAIHTLRNGGGFKEVSVDRKAQSLVSIYLQGLLINLLNPKIVVFFVTFLPQFVDPGNDNALGTLLLLGFLFPVIAFPVMAPMVVFAGRLVDLLKSSPKVARSIDYLFSAVLGGFAVKLLLARAG